MFDIIDSAEGSTVRLEKDHWHRRGDASTWLRSPIFDLKEARSEEAETAILQARELMQTTPA